MKKIKGLILASCLLFGLAGCSNNTPYIGENGNWWVNGKDLGVPAAGQPGKDGQDGKDGEDGSDGKDGEKVTITSVYFDRTEDGKDWYIITYSDGTTTSFSMPHPEDGSDGDKGDPGLTPRIGENGNWWIGDNDTGTKAAGEDGKNISIINISLTSSNGLVDTYTVTFSDGDPFVFTVTNGRDGIDGETPYIGDNGNWWIGDIDTGVVADPSKSENRIPTDGLYFTATVKNGQTGFLVSSYVGSATDIVIPNYVGNAKVIGIEDKAFQSNTTITSVSLSKFSTYIGTYAFDGCEALASFDFNESKIETISEYAFRNCETLAAISFPDELKTIRPHAFYGCVGLESVTFTESIDDIQTYAFYGCTGLTSVEIQSNVKTIGNYAFSDCTNIESLIVNEGVEELGSYCFARMAKLTTVAIPNSVKTIGASAFYGCGGLTSMTLPFIGEQRELPYEGSYFDATNMLFGYIFGTSYYSNSTATSQYYARYYYDSTNQIYTLGDIRWARISYYIPSSLTSLVITDDNTIQASSLNYCSSLDSVTIIDSNVIEPGVFYSTNVTSVSILNLEGWVYSSTKDASTGTELNLNELNNSEIALLIRNTYRSYYWIRSV